MKYNETESGRKGDGMKVLVLGVAGLYGVHLVEELISHQDICKVYGLDDFSRGYPPEEDVITNPWGKKVEIIKERFQDLSLKDLNSLNVDIVIHLAGYNSRKESINIPEDYFSNNEYGTFQLMQNLLKTKNRPFFIYASTTEVYGESVYTPVDEKHHVSPQNTYAVTKLAAERHILAIAKLYNYPASILRLTSTFGENQNICGYTSVISSFIDRALRNEPLIIYGSGKQLRDFIYVKDAVKAMHLAVVNRGAIQGYVINIATGTLTCICDLAEKIKHLTGSSSEIIKLPCEKGDSSGFVINTELAQRLLGWAPDYQVDEGLLRTICWYKGLKSI